MTAKCPICDKEFKNEAGMTGHLRFSHPGAGMVTESALESLKSEVLALREVVTKALGSGAEVATKATLEATEEVAKKTRRKGKMDDDEVMTVKDYKIEKLGDELARVRAELAAALNRPAPEMPALSDVIRHCESGECASHAAQLADYRKKVEKEIHTPPTVELFNHWQDCPTCKPMLEERGKEIRANVLNQLTKDEVSQAMKRHGIKPAPKEIIIKGIK